MIKESKQGLHKSEKWWSKGGVLVEKGWRCGGCVVAAVVAAREKGAGGQNPHKERGRRERKARKF